MREEQEDYDTGEGGQCVLEKLNLAKLPHTIHGSGEVVSEMFLVLGDDDDDQIGWANFSGKLCRQRCSKVNVFFMKIYEKLQIGKRKLSLKLPMKKIN